MFVFGFGVRLLTLTGEVGLQYAAAAECMVYSTGLIVLAVSVDRRLTGPASFYGLTALFLVFTSWPSSYVFCIGSVAACLSFFWPMQAAEEQDLV